MDFPCDSVLPCAESIGSDGLKNPHFYPEKDSIFRKFQTFVSQTKIPGERLFENFFWIVLALASTANALPQPEVRWKVPEVTETTPWQVAMVQGVVLVGSPHSNWVSAYSERGQLLWKRRLAWPWGQSLINLNGEILFPGPGWLLQPATGELRLQVPLSVGGWTVPWSEGSDWLHLSPQGEIQLGEREHPRWETRLQLRLPQGDRWWGPPVVQGKRIFVGTSQGELRSIQWGSPPQVRPLAPLPRPLFAPVAHPLGVLGVSLEGRIALRSPERNWEARFPGWKECFSEQGVSLASPQVDEAGNAYVALRHSLRSWDASGKLRWQRPLACQSHAFLHEGGLYVVDASPALLQLAPASGQVLQCWPLAGPLQAEPFFDGGKVALLLDGGELWVLALDGLSEPATPGR